MRELHDDVPLARLSLHMPRGNIATARGGPGNGTGRQGGARHGAGSGLGRSIALAFARAGASLALIDINEATAQATLDATGADGAVAAADVAVTLAVGQAVDDLADRVGAPDVVVNTAGIAGAGRRPLHETSIEDWERVLAVNLTGAFLVCRAALPLMLERGAGVIVNVASAAGLVALPGRSGYAASKAGLIHLTRTLAVEYAEAGIRANTPSAPAMPTRPWWPPGLLTPSGRRAYCG
jgi:NAD(P)-dependent dehydrogenase (short-subunit alcohol dehydrogenase family)